MKRLIVITLILIAATAYITVKYFKNLNTAGVHAVNVMRTIPGDAALVFEFTNEKSFYDIYKDNTLLSNLIGDRNTAELDTVRKLLFDNPLVHYFFNGRNVYLSIHPAAGTDMNMMLTASAARDFDVTGLEQLSKQQKTGLLITPLKIGERTGFTIYFASLKKRLYFINTEANIFSASFSKDLITATVNYKADKNNPAFLALPDQQNSNSLANLYVNYGRLTPLFDQLFKTPNTDIFKSFRLLPALAALNLNYKTDAIMFNGYTNILHNKPGSYLGIFALQQPVVNRLKEIFPSTTAYATTMAVYDPAKFSADLAQFQLKAGLKKEKEQLMAKVKNETGINVDKEVTKLLSNEFAVITTRYQENIAIISVKNGLDLRPFVVNVSSMVTDDVGQFNYNKLPYFLFGDAFSVFRRPYFRIVDNYLILANSRKEIDSYYDTYVNRKFLNKTQAYNNFDDLAAERSNVAFFIHFKNAQQILKGQLNSSFYDAYKNYTLTWGNFYAASYQFTATDKNFYTNFCMQLNPADTTVNK